MKLKKIVFFGTPDFASHVFSHLLENKILIVGVVTQPDKPKGRSLQLTPSSVKKVCPENIPLFQPNRSSDPEFIENLRSLAADLFVVVAFGQILPQKLLEIPPLGCINVHASLLPKYRGAAPIQRALLNGDLETGVSIQKMVKELDAGDVIDEVKIPLPLEMNFGELEASLCNLSKDLLMHVLEKYEQGVPKARAQDAALVTFAPKIAPEELKIDWRRSNFEIHNQVRAFSPKPGAWCSVLIQGETKRLKILTTQMSDQKAQIGQIVPDQKLIVGCGQGSLILHAVQPEGKSKMSGSDWLRGFKNSAQPPVFINI